MTTERFEFANADGETLAARLERPAGEPRAWAVFAHCFTCSKDVRAATTISRALSDRGFGVLRFDFTGLGNSEGDFANTNFSSNIDDLVAAAQALGRAERAPTLLVGHSLGGAAVLAATARLPDVKAVATIGAPSEASHVEQLLVGSIAEIEAQGSAEVNLAGRRFNIHRQFLEDLSNHSLRDTLGDMRAALLIFHSPIDNIVGIDHARDLFEAARHPKSFVSLDGADHLVSRREDAEYVAAVLSGWASRYLAAESDTDDAAPASGVVRVSEGPVRHGQRIVTGRHTLVADEPESVGGRDTGPGPYELLLSALGACTTMTVRMYADHKSWPLEHVAVRLSHDRIHAKDCEKCESETGLISRIDKTLELRGDLTDEQRARLTEISERCPVHRTITNEKQMVTQLDESIR
jgi:putative redox protein